MADYKIVLKGITKRYPGVTVIDNIDLEIPERDFVTLLGPSGCGKTTTLRIIAGLEEPDEGEIWIDDRLVFSAKRGINLPASERQVGLIFQSYALWPHMTVFENVSFGLHGKMDKRAIEKRVRESLEQVYLERYVDRYPSELSGGQQQRVAVARMLSAQPNILLMDEPLSNLDAKLRMQMRAELKRMHNDLDVTVVYVTHDQEEALTLSSKIAVMNEAIIEQFDEPGNIYKFPANRFVADFIGNPQMNFLNGTVKREKDQAKILLGKEEITYPNGVVPEGDYIVGMRPEDLSVKYEKTANALEGKVYAALPAGSNVIIYISVEGTELIVREERDVEVEIDQTVWVVPDCSYLNFYDKETNLLVEY
ncbi:MAG: ABC transporter ATP-binding protein [Firmicutes bacterium]|nr:ABC transporter ATP-binding protein [Bacillota bacterium]